MVKRFVNDTNNHHPNNSVNPQTEKILILTYLRCINTIRVGFINNKNIVYIYETRRAREIIQFFLRTGLILGYKVMWRSSNKVPSQRLLQVLLCRQSRPRIIKTISTSTNRQTIKVNRLKKLSNLKTASTYLLLTSRGLLTTHEAVNMGLGGIVLMRID